MADAIRPDMRSLRFRRVPFMRDVALDPGRATEPRAVAAPHILPSTDENASAPAILSLSWLTPTPHMIAVYASPWSSPSTPQHSLPGGRHPLRAQSITDPRIRANCRWATPAPARVRRPGSRPMPMPAPVTWCCASPLTMNAISRRSPVCAATSAGSRSGVNRRQLNRCAGPRRAGAWPAKCRRHLASQRLRRRSARRYRPASDRGGATPPT